MRLKLSFSSALILASLSIFGCRANAADPPATQGVSQTLSVDDVLDALDVRGKSMQDMSVDVTMVDKNEGTGAETKYVGAMELQKEGDDDARVKIKFTARFNDDKPAPENHEYIMDDGKLVERDYISKKEITRQMVKPGQKVNLLKLGKGPFPLPIGQKKEDVKSEFDVVKVEPAKDDPSGSIHLQLVPKAKSTFARDFQTIDVWVDPPSSMPMRIKTLDMTGATSKTTDLTNVKINTGLEKKDFEEPPLPPGWEMHDEPYGE